jgi:outer membrane protein TolC
MNEVREKMELQAAQGKFKMKEANKKLAMTCKNVEKAEENLRSANLGFKEGVISSTTVMEAQTAWLQAHSQRIDAAIDVQMSKVNLKKIYGELSIVD